MSQYVDNSSFDGSCAEVAERNALAGLRQDRELNHPVNRIARGGKHLQQCANRVHDALRRN